MSSLSEPLLNDFSIEMQSVKPNKDLNNKEIIDSKDNIDQTESDNGNPQEKSCAKAKLCCAKLQTIGLIILAAFILISVVPAFFKWSSHVEHLKVSQHEDVLGINCAKYHAYGSHNNRSHYCNQMAFTMSLMNKTKYDCHVISHLKENKYHLRDFESTYYGFSVEHLYIGMGISAISTGTALLSHDLLVVYSQKFSSCSPNHIKITRNILLVLYEIGLITIYFISIMFPTFAIYGVAFKLQSISHHKYHCKCKCYFHYFPQDLLTCVFASIGAAFAIFKKLWNLFKIRDSNMKDYLLSNDSGATTDVDTNNDNVVSSRSNCLGISKSTWKYIAIAWICTFPLSSWYTTAFAIHQKNPADWNSNTLLCILIVGLVSLGLVWAVRLITFGFIIKYFNSKDCTLDIKCKFVILVIFLLFVGSMVAMETLFTAKKW